MKNNSKGLTLIALIVSVVILIILASITISTIRDNGTIKNTIKAKESSEIADEKEIVSRATVNSSAKNKYGKLEKEELQGQLDSETEAGKTTVIDAGNEFEIIFNETNRIYTVSKKGQITGSKEIIKDLCPGDITKGKDGETLDGSKEHPFEIWCIEDLVSFSNMVNGSGIMIKDGQPVQVTHREYFIDQYVQLKQDLNFKSKMSYENSERTDFGNLNGISGDSNTLINEMTTGTGFTPIGAKEDNDASFWGNFEGNNKKIQEIYINKEGIAGLFGMLSQGIIKNLEVSGNVTATGEESVAGGIVAQGIINSQNSKIENCISKVNVNAVNAGGIIGHKKSSPKGLTISNCINCGNVNGERSGGGIAGIAYTSTNIINCSNSGKISGGDTFAMSGIGGIVGTGMFTTSIINSYNTGNITAVKNVGGILGWVYWSETHIENCYNIGSTTGTINGGILGGSNINNELFVTKNVFYSQEKTAKSIGQGISESEEDIIATTIQDLQSNETLNKLNKYVTDNPQKEETELKQWKKGESGYLEFK